MTLSHEYTCHINMTFGPYAHAFACVRTHRHKDTVIFASSMRARASVIIEFVQSNLQENVVVEPGK